MAFSPLMFAKQHKSPIPKEEAITCSQSKDFKPEKDAPMKVDGSCSDIITIVKNLKINVWNDLMPSIGKKKFPGHILIESKTGELEKLEVKSGYLLAPTGLLKIPLKLEKTARDVSTGQASQFHLFSPEKINLSHKLYLSVFYKKQLLSLKVNLPNSIQETY
jgi:hypothetical protein